ncbi:MULTISPECIES: hypothetical protein [unclassified Nitrobacter]|uniref:hypothetical protein n=1 Tax=unclassified Nitrobacter TaxID=2620411 RepID=UPI00092C4A0A|nr:MULTISPECIES: hypothetical protein [unclassified Nitrobacter]MBN9148438.1 hypothetical protein [Nitrobacter sp.]OJV00485.1 MAG: hypothetical protein BGO16_00455 [Nitrobacter sp. 62-23]
MAAPHDRSRDGLLKTGAAGVGTGILTPLIDHINGAPADLRIALLAVPFALLVLVLIQIGSDNPRWAALAGAVVTVIAFVWAVSAAVWIDGRISVSESAVRNVLSGLAGGFVGSGTLAFGVSLLPASPRDPLAWLPMLVTGTSAGALLALDDALNLDLVSTLYPVWQAGVAICLAMALRRRTQSA